MPSNLLQIGATVDVAELKTGLDSAANSVRGSVGEMSGSFAQLAAESEAATSKISSGWLQAAKSSLALSAAKKEVRNASREAKDAEDDDAAALAKLALAQQKAAAAAEEFALAQKAVGAATEHVVPEMAAASAEIRVFEGTLPIRAVERFLSTTLGLGPVMKAAFPIVGAIALGEMLGVVAEKVIKVYQNFIQLKEVEEEVAAVEERLGHATVKAFEETARLAEEHLKNLGHYVEAAEQHRQNLQNKPIDLAEFLKSDDIDKKLKQLPADMREELKRTFTSILPGDIDSLVRTLKTRVGDATAEMAKLQAAQKVETVAPGLYGPTGSLVSGQLDERAINQQKAKADIYSGLLQFLQQEQQRYAAETVVATDQVGKAREEEARKTEEAARKAQEALRQKVDALRKTDEDSLNELRLNAAQQGIQGQALLQQERVFLESRMAAESQYADRVRDLRKQLDTVVIDSLKEFEKAQKLANEAVRQGVEEAKKYEEALNRASKAESTAFEKQLKKRDEDTKDQQEILLGRFKAGSEGNVNQLQLQKLQVERQFSLGDGGTSAQIAELRAMQAIDDQIVQEKLRTARALAEIDKINDPKKYAQELQQIAQLEAQADQKRYSETTKILELEQRQYEKFFTTITQSFTKGVNQWIQHQKTFA